jgi:dihydroxyacid dehydratase/phosphogluconate dehydratase
MVRISDARMSGTAYGTVVLHASPEAAAGGPLARVRTGDPIVLDVPNRRLDVDVPDLNDRPIAQAAADAFATPDRGWQRMYVEHVLQADEGADLDFLRGKTTTTPTRESH